MQLIPIKDVRYSNLDLNQKVIDAILKEGIDPKKLGVLPAYKYPKTKAFLLTDGNHRLFCLSKIGARAVPIAELTKEEFDYVKCSDRTLDLEVRL